MNGRPVANPNLRVSDAERAEVAELLKRHCADGRLDQAEFEARLDRALRAKTRADLAGLFDDLPNLDTGPPARGRPSTRPRHHSALWAAVVVAAVALFVAAALSTMVSFVRFRVPWLVVALIVLAIWHRGHHHGCRRYG